MAEAPYPDPPERPYPKRPTSPVPKKSFSERHSIAIDKNIEEAFKYMGLEGIRKKDPPKSATGESTGAKPKKVVRSPKSTQPEKQSEASKKEDRKPSISDGLIAATRVGITAVPQAAPMIPEQQQPEQESRRGMFRSFSDRILRRRSTGYELLPPTPPSNVSSRTPQSDHSSHLSTSIDPEIFEPHGSSTYSESSVGPMPDITAKLAHKQLVEEGYIDDSSTSDSMTYEPKNPLYDHGESSRRPRRHYIEESDDYASSSDPAPQTSTSEEATDESSEARTEAQQQATAAATERPRKSRFPRFPQLTNIFTMYSLDRGPGAQNVRWERMGNGNSANGSGKNNGSGDDPPEFYRRVYYEETWIEESRYEARWEDGSDADAESDDDDDENIGRGKKEYDEQDMYSSESVSEKWEAADVSSRYESRDSGISGSDGNVASVSESHGSDGRVTSATGSSGSDSLVPGFESSGSGRITPGVGTSSASSSAPGSGKAESGNVSDGDGAGSSVIDSIGSGDGKAGSGNVSGGAVSSGTDSITSGDGKAGSGCPADTTEVRPSECPEPKSFLARILERLPSRNPPPEGKANTLPLQKEEGSQKSVHINGACPAWTEEYIRNSPVFRDGDDSVTVTCDWDDLEGFRMSTRSYRSSSGSTDASDSDEESDRS